MVNNSNKKTNHYEKEELFALKDIINIILSIIIYLYFQFTLI